MEDAREETGFLEPCRSWLKNNEVGPDVPFSSSKTDFEANVPGGNIPTSINLGGHHYALVKPRGGKHWSWNYLRKMTDDKKEFVFCWGCYMTEITAAAEVD
jgi:hypothetical protein